ncbi:MAG: DUF475 domain-containing protein [Bacteroidota bacterium]
MMIDTFAGLLQEISDKPVASFTIVVNLILIESLLSVDNAAVLATMVLDIPKDQRSKALRYGIIGAYVFRGVSLYFASLLIRIWWFKPLGGLYLLVLAIRYFIAKKNDDPDTDAVDKNNTWIYNKTLGLLGPFWATVVLVELMDMAFSIDNVVAANAYSRNIVLVWSGVFIGILAMRFVAQAFVRLMEKYRFLETSAYTVIAILGIKLTASLFTQFYPCSALAIFMDGPYDCSSMKVSTEQPVIWGEVWVSAISIAVFFLPILSSVLFNFPRHNKDI